MKRSRSGSHLPALLNTSVDDLTQGNDDGGDQHSACTASPPLALIHPRGSQAAIAGVAAHESRPDFIDIPTTSLCSGRRGLPSNSIPGAAIAQVPKLSPAVANSDVLEHAVAASISANQMGGWPCRSYGCSFCGREFNSAQALGGHMNIHRRDRARLRTSLDNSQAPYSATDYQTAIFASPHAAAHHTLVANLPFSASLAEYPIAMTPLGPLGSLNPLRPRNFAPVLVSPNFATDENPSRHSSRLEQLYMSPAVASLPSAATTSFSDLPLQRSTSAPVCGALSVSSFKSNGAPVLVRPESHPDFTERSRTSCYTASSAQFAAAVPLQADGGRWSLSSQSSSSGTITSSCALRNTGDLHSLQYGIAVSTSPAMHHVAQPVLSSSSNTSLDLELRLGQISPPSPAAAGSH